MSSGQVQSSFLYEQLLNVTWTFLGLSPLICEVAITNAPISLGCYGDYVSSYIKYLKQCLVYSKSSKNGSCLGVGLGWGMQR